MGRFLADVAAQIADDFSLLSLVELPFFKALQMNAPLASDKTRSRSTLPNIERTHWDSSTSPRFVEMPVRGNAPIGLRVLCVDDSRDSADSLGMLLELLGCEVETCYCGQAALVLASEFRPHACLLDLKMPEMDGFELAKRLRESAKGRPLLIIAVTAFGSRETRMKCVKHGFNLHLTKPVNVAILKDVLRDF